MRTSKIVMNGGNGLELGKSYDAVGFFLNVSHRTDCVRHTVLLSLRESIAHALAMRSS
jgi:hypothetical protein